MKGIKIKPYLGYTAHGKPKISNHVFLVNKYETADGIRHDVTVWDKKGRGMMYRIHGWAKAKKFAEGQTRKIGLNKYLIDSPTKIGWMKLKKVI